MPMPTPSRMLRSRARLTSVSKNSCCLVSAPNERVVRMF